MASSYFQCPQCGVIELITYKAADVDAAGWPPVCQDAECDARMIFSPQPGDFAMDVGGVKGAAFKAFTVDVDGQMTTIDSLHTLRRVERESEQRYRNGEGEPMRFRMWNQDRSNKDVHAFGTTGTIGEQHYDSGQAPPSKREKIGVRRHGETKPRIKVARGAGQSALKG